MKRLAVSWILFALTSAAASSAAPPSDFEDPDVRDAIAREFFVDRAVPSHRLDVEVEKGIATIRGKVDNLLAKERATRLAETVKGVRSVVNLVTVSPSVKKSDAQLVEHVKSALSSDPATSAYGIEVTVHEGHVVLSGHVDSWQEKQLSATVAKGVDGVVDFTNDIAVAYESDRTDNEIMREIEAALRWNALVDHGLVEVTVDGGEVQLSGIVGSAAEKRQARIDAWVAGVKTVDDSALEVARWARDDDLRKDKYVFESQDEIRDAVRTAMALDPRVDEKSVDAVATRSVVTLRGVVANLRAKRAAEQDARNTVGVAAVRNYLKVRPVEERENDDIESDVRSAFRRDPYVERYDVIVSVHDGTVYLSGNVDSYFEKGQADDLASRVDGVTNVVNNLVVQDSPYAHDPYVDSWSIYGHPWPGQHPYYTLDTDWTIRRDIQDELYWSPFVDADEVSVTVDDGVATLTGTVDSWMELGAARDNALEGGAVRVRNRLEVDPSAEPDPSDVQ